MFDEILQSERPRAQHVSTLDQRGGAVGLEVRQEHVTFGHNGVRTAVKSTRACTEVTLEWKGIDRGRLEVGV